MFALQSNHSRKNQLNIHLVFFKPEEIVSLKELLCGPLGVLAGHDVHQDAAAADASLKLGEFLKSTNPLHLDLVECLLRRQPDVVHPLGVGHPKPSPLTPGKKKNPALVPRDCSH